MTQEDIEQALAELEELGSIEFYDLIRTLPNDGTHIAYAYCDSIASHRNDTLHILIQAKLLSEEQLARIKKIDDYVLSHTVPERLQELKDWLKTNAL